MRRRDGGSAVLGCLGRAMRVSRSLPWLQRRPEPEAPKCFRGRDIG